MKSGWIILALLLLPPALEGCRVVRAVSANVCHDPKQTYLQAISVPPLKIPAGLDAPDTSNALKLPQLNEPAPPPRRGNQPCLDAPPSFKVQQPTVVRPPQA
jgi:uncharacterized lipoprotein